MPETKLVKYTAEQFMQAHGLEWEIRHHMNPTRVLASFDHVETKEYPSSQLVCGTFGSGDTIREAQVEYLRKISGMILVHNSMGPDRRTFDPVQFDWQSFGVLVHYQELHISLDKLAAEYIDGTEKLLGGTSILELMEWSGKRIQARKDEDDDESS